MSEPTPAPAPEVGPKTQAALDALDDAIDKVQVFHETDDENDAAPIWERVQRLQEKLAAGSIGTSHMPKDALTGLPVDPATANVDLGPAAPVVTPEPTPVDETPPAEEPMDDGTSTGRRRSGES